MFDTVFQDSSSFYPPLIGYGVLAFMTFQIRLGQKFEIGNKTGFGKVLLPENLFRNFVDNCFMVQIACGFQCWEFATLVYCANKSERAKV